MGSEAKLVKIISLKRSHLPLILSMYIIQFVEAIMEEIVFANSAFEFKANDAF